METVYALAVCVSCFAGYGAPPTKAPPPGRVGINCFSAVPPNLAPEKSALPGSGPAQSRGADVAMSRR